MLLLVEVEVQIYIEVDYFSVTSIITTTKFI